MGEFRYDFISEYTDMSNKLFGTFVSKDNLEGLINNINKKYTILYNKIFILSIKDSDEFLCTYNIDTNLSRNIVFPNTLLIHRKKETNTLYTINALNELIKVKNNGVYNPKFEINWKEHSNRIILTQNYELKELHTSIYKIVSF